MDTTCSTCGTPMATPPDLCARCGPGEVVVGSPAPSPSVVVRQPLALVAPPAGPEVTAMSLTPPDVSPTGKPLLPPWLPAVGAAIVAAAYALQQVLPDNTIGD